MKTLRLFLASSSIIVTACTAELATQPGGEASSDEQSPCPSNTTSQFADCSGFSDPCDETGTRSRTITTYDPDTCAPHSTIEKEECFRTTDGEPCTEGTCSDGVCVSSSSDAAAPGCSDGEKIEEPCGNCGTRTRACIGGEMGDWSECLGQRECLPGTTQSCPSGTGSLFCASDCMWTGTCEDPSCPPAVEGDFSECSEFTDACDETGARTRTITTYEAGSCSPQNSTETEECTRTTEGVPCAGGTCAGGTCVSTCEADPSAPGCGDCTEDIVEPCGNCGARTQTCVDGKLTAWSECLHQGDCAPGTTQLCSVGDGMLTCDSSCTWTGSCLEPTCPAPAYGEFTECSGFTDPCDQTGAQTRSVTTYQPETCTPETATETQECMRYTDGAACAGGTCAGGSCNLDPACTYSVSPEYPSTSSSAPYTCPGGIVMAISGEIDEATGKLVVRVHKSGFGPGTYRVLVFDPDDSLEDQCAPYNVVKTTKTLSSSTDSDTLVFDAFDSLLQCGGSLNPKAYCVVKEDGGSIAHFCSGKLVVGYE
jgi:hypothetical protein